MTAVVVMMVVALVLAALAVQRSRSRRASWSDGVPRRAHTSSYLAGGAVLGDAGGSWSGGGFDGGGGGGDGGGGGC
jgi:uncharacterized membrane protein YgcG